MIIIPAKFVSAAGNGHCFLGWDPLIAGDYVPSVLIFKDHLY